jgi:hypothetical protein
MWIGAYRWLPAFVIALLVVAAYAATSAVAPGSDRRSRLVVAAGVVALVLAGMPAGPECVPTDERSHACRGGRQSRKPVDM